MYNIKVLLFIDIRISVRFVVAMWKKDNENYHGNRKIAAKSGLQIKVVDSIKGPSSDLRNALWHTGDTVTNEVGGAISHTCMSRTHSLALSVRGGKTLAT